MARIIIYVIVALVLVVGGLVIFVPDVVRHIFGAPDLQTRIQGCLASTGETRGLKVNLTPDGNNLSIEFDGGVALEGSKDAEVVSKVLDCVQAAFREEGVENDYHVKTQIPIGLVADQWDSGTPSLLLDQPADQDDLDRLMNLVFGPASGMRSALIEQWCDLNSGCIRCAPNLGAGNIADASTVTIGLSGRGSFQKVVIGTAPLAGNRAQPFQIVEPAEGLAEGIGERVGFLCSE